MSEGSGYPEHGDEGFGRSLQAKLEMNPVASSQACPGSAAQGRGDGRARFDLHPVQQFVTAYMSPMTPYRSLLLFHGTGVGKTCTAVNVAESFAAAGRQPLLVVPQAVAGQFRRTMYDVGRIPADEEGRLDLRASARAQCLGTAHVIDDAASRKAGVTRRGLWLSAQQKLGRRYRVMGHEVFGNQVGAMRERVAAEFTNVSESVIEKELTARIRSNYDGRLIVVDEVHDMIPRGASSKERPAYEALLEVVGRCRDVRLLLMTATPMFDRASEVVPLLNLMLSNEGEAPLRVEGLIDRAGTTAESLTREGAEAIRRAAMGRVSFATGDDPRSFPAVLSALEAGIPGAGKLGAPPRLDFNGRPIPEGESWESVGDDLSGTTDDPARVVVSELSELQEGVLRKGARSREGASPTDAVLRQVCNVVFDAGLGEFTGEEQFRSAFQVSMSSSSGMQVSARRSPNPLSEGKIGNHAPKFKKILDQVVGSARKGHLSFVFSSYVWSGVLPLAVALELRGVMPAKGRPLLNPAPKADPSLGTYVIISKHPSLDPSWSVTDKVSAANAGGSGVTVVLGSEMASQGLDFAAVRQIHIVEPWYNSSRTHQVVGRGVRRCSHGRLAPEDRNVTVAYHAARYRARKWGAGELGERETVDLKSLRYARLKRRAVREVERLLRQSSLDCDLYHRFSGGDPSLEPDSGGAAWSAEQVSSSGKRVRPSKSSDRDRRLATCAMPWKGPGAGSESTSTFHPYMWRHRTDMTALDIAWLLQTNRAMTFDEVLAAVGPEQTELSVALALDVLMDPLRAGKYLEPDRVVYVSGTYVLAPYSINQQRFTLREARAGRVFGGGDPMGLKLAVEKSPGGGPGGPGGAPEART